MTEHEKLIINSLTSLLINLAGSCLKLRTNICDEELLMKIIYSSSIACIVFLFDIQNTCLSRISVGYIDITLQGTNVKSIIIYNEVSTINIVMKM